MKLVSFLLSALALLAQQPQANQPHAPPETKPEDLCAIEGQVTSGATGAPLRKAEISLRGTELATPDCNLNIAADPQSLATSPRSDPIRGA